MSLEKIIVDDETADVKNQLVSADSQISLKYAAAGKIANSVMSYLVEGIRNQRLSNIYDICHTGDLLIEQEAGKIYKSIDEKGIAGPTTVDVNNCVYGYSPLERDSAYILNNGDVAKISLAVHIDGYTALVSHTLIALPTIPLVDQVAATTGPLADAICATHLALQAVTSLLGTVLYRFDNRSGYFQDRPVNGTRIKELVESIAKTFNVKIVPGSSVRRIKRFLVGQDTVHEMAVKGCSWGSLNVEEGVEDLDEINQKKEFDMESSAETGDAWLIDISMCTFSGLESDLSKRNSIHLGRRTIKRHRQLKPTIFTRDYNRNLSMKLKSARGVLTEVDNRKSVYPFHVRALETPGALLGLAALSSSHIVSPTEVLMAQGSPAPLIARQRTTILLMPTVKHIGEVLRLAGGNIKPSWVHSEFEIVDKEIQQLLDPKSLGIRIKNIDHQIKGNIEVEGTRATEYQEMDV
ncbi:hypothetical protein V1511DRAFT_496991, partial [Dipodascopsis uninucleata]